MQSLKGLFRFGLATPTLKKCCFMTALCIANQSAVSFCKFFLLMQFCKTI
ncbi:unknown [[Mannheimia] succiniciproducens MBEL55E]|uniref:Uncharacterized protein n=1 Tax=Mannheimia succiniciproducens (strain KCTC 0769BP / MBEL55E) TaxID=221988 RepID=Q65QF3_MANSM|nr:unknown [[Mannheimia] succiniciproducens MBEL55E]